jgi:hypothetical protein
MRKQINGDTIKVWLSKRDTENWSERGRWPCSQLSGRSVFAEFHDTDLVDMQIDGGRGKQDCDCSEFNAIMHDAIRRDRQFGKC